jgi:CHAD domain-containing protein/CYTH domain-containing protein
MLPFDATILDEPTPRGARLIALALLDDLVAERERLATDRGVESLHDFRVALRRVRSWLSALRPALSSSVSRGVRRRLRRIAKASNAGRDAEVFLAWLRAVEGQLPSRKRTSARWLIERFERQLREANASLDDLLMRDFQRVEERLREQLESYRLAAHVHSGMRDPTLAATLSALIGDLGDRLQDRLGRIRSADEDREIHRARISGKRLRYLLEPVSGNLEGGGPLVDRLKGLQDALGDLHDAHIWLMMLGDMAAQAALEEGRRLSRTRSGTARTDHLRGERFPALGGFALLGFLAQDHAREAYGRFSTGWGKRRSRRFFALLSKAADALEGRARRGIEIERKYLLSGMPELPQSAVSTTRIMQGYLPGLMLVERLRAEGPEASNGRPDSRSRDTRFYRTVKSGSGIARLELEEETTREIFETMWPLTGGRRVTKLRHRVPAGDLTWEIDEFTELGLVLAEIELPSVAASVEIPPWLAPYVTREVTGERAYLNSTLAR